MFQTLFQTLSHQTHMKISNSLLQGFSLCIPHSSVLPVPPTIVPSHRCCVGYVLHQPSISGKCRPRAGIGTTQHHRNAPLEQSLPKPCTPREGAMRLGSNRMRLNRLRMALVNGMGKLFNMRQVEVIKLRLKVVDFGWNV
ncbi:uncharacterized protein LOC115974254 [Quercus lobata]|uniref:uncharacterized protein LOC115974254 n=1 Tax=Quercus lobata TaxID=97700 RepID=UPI001247ACCA|nr:uncharacterized protein LOC115974254 [Quercus lobata]